MLNREPILKGHVVTVRTLVPVDVEVHITSDLPVADLMALALEKAKKGAARGYRRWDEATPYTLRTICNAATGAVVLGADVNG